jgi:hypothetical protein
MDIDWFHSPCSDSDVSWSTASSGRCTRPTLASLCGDPSRPWRAEWSPAFLGEADEALDRAALFLTSALPLSARRRQRRRTGPDPHSGSAPPRAVLACSDPLRFVSYPQNVGGGQRHDPVIVMRQVCEGS